MQPDPASIYPGTDLEAVCRDVRTRLLLQASVRHPWLPEAAPYLDALVRRCSAFGSFDDLTWRAEAHGYRPSLYPTGGWPDLLAWAYDNYMARAGLGWRAFPDYGSDPHRPYGRANYPTTYVIREPGAWSDPRASTQPTP